jgi:hypothetical protein
VNAANKRYRKLIEKARGLLPHPGAVVGA